jgi:hypothetical protein
MRACLGDASDGIAEAVQHGDVLGDGDAVGGAIQRFEVGIPRAAVGVAMPPAILAAARAPLRVDG